MWSRRKKNPQHNNQIISQQERIDIIMRAVANNQLEMLQSLSARGWNLNVRHLNGYTPVQMAIDSGHVELAQRLIAPIEDGGFGLPIEKRELRRLVEDRIDLSFFEGGYHRAKPGRKHSFFSLPLARNDEYSLETYEPEAELGHGAFGDVRLFASTEDASRKLVVKRVKQDRLKEELSPWHIYVTAENVQNELRFLQRAYPDEGPYKIQHYVVNGGKQYDCRIVMPFVRGKELADIVLATKSAEEFARYFLAVAKELQRLHDLGMIHGDPRPRNILTDVSRGDDGKVTYKVHFIDFYSANDIGVPAERYSSTREDIPPEQRQQDKAVLTHPSQDVYVFGHYFKSAVKVFKKLLRNDFPDMLKFCDACKHENPDERPALKDFIRDLEREIVQCAAVIPVKAGNSLM